MAYTDLERDLSLARKLHELRRQDCHLRGLDEPVWDPSFDDYPPENGSDFVKGFLFAAAVVAVVVILFLIF